METNYQNIEGYIKDLESKNIKVIKVHPILYSAILNIEEFIDAWTNKKKPLSDKYRVVPYKKRDEGEGPI